MSDAVWTPWPAAGKGGTPTRQRVPASPCAPFTRSEGLLDVPLLRGLWAAFRQLPREAPDVMSRLGRTTLDRLLTGR